MDAEARALRRTLRLNGEFSVLSGLVFMLAAGFLAGALFRGVDGLFGLSLSTVVLIVGAAVVVFGVDVFLVSLLGRPRWGVVAAVMVTDVGWVAGSVALVVLARPFLTGAGIAVVVAVAAVVAAFAVAEWRGLRRLREAAPLRPSLAGAGFSPGDGHSKAAPTGKKRGAKIGAAEAKGAPRAAAAADPRRVVQLTVARDIQVAPAVAWRVMTDHRGYADVADNLSRVAVLEGHGLGMRRRCFDTKERRWTERCVVWEEGRRFSFLVDTAAADYPYPLQRLQGTWALEPIAGGTRVRMDFAATAKGGRFGHVLLLAMRWPARRLGERLLAKWELRMLMAGRSRRPDSAPPRPADDDKLPPPVS